MSSVYPTKFDQYKEEKENDEKFSNIPDDLITEYLDLHQEKILLVQHHQMRLDDLIQQHERKKKKILLSLDSNYVKMAEISGLAHFALSRRLPPKRDIEPPF